MKWFRQLWEWAKGLLGIAPAPEPLAPLDLTLIRDYTRKDDAETPLRPTAINHFHKGDKHLYYINAGHQTGTNNPTCALAQTAIAQFRPQLVIIEGFETDKGPSPAFFLDEIRKHEANGFAHAGESVVAAGLAHKNSIPFIGGEASEAEIFAKMNEAGYSAKEVMAFYLLRFIPQWQREGKTEAEFPELAARVLHNTNAFTFVPLQDRLTLEEFKQWYDAHNSTGKPFWQTEPNDFAPYHSPDASYFQQMNHAIGRIREDHLDTTIAGALKANDRVLVVYGGGHLVQSRKVFETMFASPGQAIG